MRQSGLPAKAGFLKKLSHKGLWQSRYFECMNGYLNYFKGSDKKELLASINLEQVRSPVPSLQCEALL